MATALKVKPRPENLKLLTDYPDDPPITVPNDTGTDESVLDWIEETRDHYQREGLKVSYIGMCKIAEAAGLDPTQTSELKARIKTVLADEVKKAKAKKPAAKPVAKKMVKAMAKPSKNGVAKKPAAKTNGEKKSFGGESKVIYTAKVRGVDVEVRKTLEEGKFMVNLFGEHPIRKVMQWMGASGWITGEAAIACNRLLAGCKALAANIGGVLKKGPEAYVKATLNEGHIGSGKRAGFQKKGCFGPVAKLTKDQAKLIVALRK